MLEDTDAKISPKGYGTSNDDSKTQSSNENEQTIQIHAQSQRGNHKLDLTVKRSWEKLRGHQSGANDVSQAFLNDQSRDTERPNYNVEKNVGSHGTYRQGFDPRFINNNNQQNSQESDSNINQTIVGTGAYAQFSRKGTQQTQAQQIVRTNTRSSKTNQEQL